MVFSRRKTRKEQTDSATREQEEKLKDGLEELLKLEEALSDTEKKLLKWAAKGYAKRLICLALNLSPAEFDRIRNKPENAQYCALYMMTILDDVFESIKKKYPVQYLNLHPFFREDYGSQTIVSVTTIGDFVRIDPNDVKTVSYGEDENIASALPSGELGEAVAEGRADAAAGSGSGCDQA